MRLIWRGLRPTPSGQDEDEADEAAEPRDPVATFAIALRVLVGMIAGMPVPLLLAAAIVAGGGDAPPLAIRVAMIVYPMTLLATAALLVFSPRVAFFGGVAAMLCAIAVMRYWWNDWLDTPLADRDRFGAQARLTIWYCGAAVLATPLILAAWLADLLRRPPEVAAGRESGTLGD